MIFLYFRIYAIVPFLVIFPCNVFLVTSIVKHARNKLLGKNNQMENHLRISVMLMTLSFYFIISTLPYFIYFHFADQWYDVTYTFADHNPVLFAVDIVNLSNFSSNFFLYSLSGAEFRNELKSLFSSCCQTKSSAPARINISLITIDTSLSSH